MAEGKSSFILYADYLETVEVLPDDVAGRLFKTILRYVNDLNPEVNELILSVAFNPIKNQLKRDLKSWEGSLEQKSLNGKIGNLKRWNKDLYELHLSGKITIKEAENIAKNRKESPSDETVSQRVAKIAVNDNVYVNEYVDVTVIDNVITKEELIVTPEKKTLEDRKKEFGLKLAEHVAEFSAPLVREFFNYWSEHSEKGKKMRFEKEVVFDIKKRLATWRKNQETKKFAPKNKESKKQQIADQVAPAFQNLMEKFENESK